MYSIVPMLARVIDEPMTFNDVTIPTGSIVNVNIHAINHRKDLWLDHDVSMTSLYPRFFFLIKHIYVQLSMKQSISLYHNLRMIHICSFLNIIIHV